ncbi:aspartate aminotransferase family protein [Novisyntrophococcus fermenticellae]|uniref:aspartate aminotransferase family protein n=1 Tax=Novisyntrophococcus fermenticellae TaxID=2068655 RepID=UPI002FE6E210
MNKYMEQTEANVLHTYNRFPLVLEKGKGVYLYDTNGKEYLDFAAGIAVFALGYGNETYNHALKDQIDQLIHTSNLYYNIPMAEASEKLVKVSGMDKVFFTNSGTEAVEGAIKVARKYAWLKDRRTDHEIIAMKHSFHGRSMGALSVTGNTHYQEPFKPLIGGIRFAEFNNLKSVEAEITNKTCAVILETVQGEGGIYPADKEFLEGVRALCDAHNMLLILDEIQCGMGRTGHMFAWQEYGVKPDVMTCAKALGCGVPVGAFVLNKKTAENSLMPGDHGTTYGGNPLVCRAVSTVLDIFEEEHVALHVQKTTPYLEKKLDEIVNEFDCVEVRRGKGFMQGLVIKGKPVGDVVNKAMENGLLVISAGTDVLRLVPPLVITETDIDNMIEKLKKCL